jgi:hypothetical protein
MRNFGVFVFNDEFCDLTERIEVSLLGEQDAFPALIDEFQDLLFRFDRLVWRARPFREQACFQPN